MMKNVSAVIVVGRESRPLKSPKQLLPFGDTTVLGRTLRAYLTAGVQEVILVLSSRTPEIRDGLGDMAGKVKVVSIDAAPSEFGAFLKAGVGAVSSSAKAIAVGLGDQPLLDGPIIDRLSEAFAAGKKKIMVPVAQGQMGLPFFLDPSLSSEVEKLGPTDDAWDLVRKHADEVHDFHIYETSIARTIDDMDDYHTLLTLAGLPIPEPTPHGDESHAPKAVASDGAATTYHSHTIEQG